MKQLLKYLHYAMLGGITVVFLALLIPTYFGELIVSFLPYALFLHTMGFIVLILAKVKLSKYAWLIHLIFLISTLSVIVNYTFTRNTETSSGLTVASYNKLIVNDLDESLHPDNYDILGVVEITQQEIETLRTQWPYAIYTECGCDSAHYDIPSELALFSKYPLVQRNASSDGVFGSLRAVAKINGTDLDIFLLHPPAPLMPAEYAKQSKQLRELSTEISHYKKVLVMGDMNLSPWSPRYRSFVATSGLVSANKGSQILSTWCLNEIPIACAQIDHIFGKNINFNKVKSVTLRGSDHRLITSEIMIK